VDQLIGSEDLPSMIMMSQNSLARQYAESFEHLGDQRYFQIKGKSNYPCHFLEAQPMSQLKTADGCVKANLHDTEVDRYCRDCEYLAAKKKVNTSSNVITNYAYFMTGKLASNHLMPRKLHIFDEAHGVNEAFCSFTEISVSSDLLGKYIKEIKEINDQCGRYAEELETFKMRVESKYVTELTYMEFIQELCRVYVNIAKTIQVHAAAVMPHSVIDGSKYERICSKFANLAVKIKDFIKNDYEHVFDDSTEKQFSVKTIFVGGTIEGLLTTKNLFMSATITESMSFDILGLNKDETTFVMVPPVYPRENKPLFFIGKGALNYEALKKPETIQMLRDQCAMIAEHHKGEKGIILSPSFYLGSQVTKDFPCRVFEHKSGTNLAEIIRSFKAYRGSAVLVSPSIFEGLDFKNDDSRFQIILKSPFASLGDKRIKHIATHYPVVYQEMTLLKILQGIGRSIRTAEDFASTYCLDATTKKLFDSPSNIWKDHYTICT
jgi:Rad3-related DNA helicase